MNGLYAAYETDANAEEEGAWITTRGGTRVKVRSESSLKVREYSRKLDKKYRAVIMTEGSLPPDIQDERDIGLLSSIVVVDWENVTDRKGNALACNPKNVTQVVTDLPAFRRDIMYGARIDEAFRKEEVEKLKGN